MQRLDATQLPIDDFVNAVIEHELGEFWPRPESEFYCRPCNYQEFSSQQELDNHNKSDMHKVSPTFFLFDFALALFKLNISHRSRRQACL